MIANTTVPSRMTKKITFTTEAVGVLGRATRGRPPAPRAPHAGNDADHSGHQPAALMMPTVKVNPIEDRIAAGRNKERLRIDPRHKSHANEAGLRHKSDATIAPRNARIGSRRITNAKGPMAAGRIRTLDRVEPPMVRSAARSPSRPSSSRAEFGRYIGTAPSGRRPMIATSSTPYLGAVHQGRQHVDGRRYVQLPNLRKWKMPCWG